MLGYDSDLADSRQFLNELSSIYHIIAPEDQELLRSENEILAIFADICSLFRRELDPVEANEQVHSAGWSIHCLLLINQRGDSQNSTPTGVKLEL